MSGSEIKVSPTGGIQPEGELYLLDFMKFLRRDSAILLGGTLMGGAMGLAVAFALPEQWEASASIRVGQLEAQPVEPIAVAMHRVTQKPFKANALKRMGVSSDEVQPENALLLSSLKVKVEIANLVGVRVRGATPGDAVRFVEALTAELADVHAKMAEPALQLQHDEVEEINAESRQLNSEIGRLKSLLEKSSGEFTATNFSQVALVSKFLLAREEQLRELLKRKREFQSKVTGEQALRTFSLLPIDVSAEPVFPSKSLFATIGLLIGLSMAALLALLRSYRFFDKDAGLLVSDR